MTDSAGSPITFLLIHACVDGAGVHGTYTDLAEAIAEANRLQAASDARGNSWSSRYVVYGPRGVECHRTVPTARR